MQHTAVASKTVRYVWQSVHIILVLFELQVTKSCGSILVTAAVGCCNTCTPSQDDCIAEGSGSVLVTAVGENSEWAKTLALVRSEFADACDVELQVTKDIGSMS